MLRGVKNLQCVNNWDVFLVAISKPTIFLHSGDMKYSNVYNLKLTHAPYQLTECNKLKTIEPLQ